jgi:threonine dehydrogenase-like Zn-dependent dehydrogenase
MGLRVIGVDVAAERVALALQCGADEAVNAMETDTVSAAQTFARRVTGIANVNGVDYVIETSGSAQGRSNVIPSLRRGGAAAIVGVGSNEKVINPSDIHGKACTLIGSVVFPMGWSWDLARFLATSGLTFEPAVTHRFTLEEAETALRMADEGKSGKVLFVPNVS